MVTATLNTTLRQYVEPYYKGYGTNPGSYETYTSQVKKALTDPRTDLYGLTARGVPAVVNDRFLKAETNTKAVVLIHELKHYREAGREIDEVDGKEVLSQDYEEIRRKCNLP